MISRIFKHSLARGSILSVVDQGICSLSNFITAILLARVVAPAQFGVYSLLFASLMVVSSIQIGLVTAPLRVFGVRATGQSADSYFKSQLVIQYCLGIGLALFSIVTIMLFKSGSIELAITFGICVFFYQLQEVGRIIQLTRFRLSVLLINDTVTHGTRVVLLLLLWRTGHLAVLTAFLTIALSCAIGAIVFHFGKSLGDRGSDPVLATLRSNWAYGRWILLEGVAHSASTHFYLYAIAVVLNSAAAGALNAVQTLLNVLNVLHMGVMSFAIPVARQKLISHGHESWKRWHWQVGVLLVSVTAVTVITLSVFAKPILGLIFTPFYSQYAYLVPILSIAYCLLAITTVLSSAFRTANLPQVGVAAKVVSAMATVIFSYPLLKMWQAAGAAIGIVLTQALWAVVFAFYISKGWLSAKIVNAQFEPKM